jgi:hypothetical protein
MTPNEIMDDLLNRIVDTSRMCGRDGSMVWVTNGIVLVTRDGGSWNPPRQDKTPINTVIGPTLARVGTDMDLAPLTIEPTPIDCPECDGTGRVRDCPQCHGDGRCECRCGHDHDCAECSGSGVETGFGDPCEDCGGSGKAQKWPAIDVSPEVRFDGRYLAMLRQLPGCGPLHYTDGRSPAWVRWVEGVGILMPLVKGS